MLLFLITVALTLSLFAALALLDLQKRDATPFLAPVLVSSPDAENQYVPAGLWHVHRLAATFYGSSSSSEG